MANEAQKTDPEPEDERASGEPGDADATEARDEDPRDDREGEEARDDEAEEDARDGARDDAGEAEAREARDDEAGEAGAEDEASVEADAAAPKKKKKGARKDGLTAGARLAAAKAAKAARKAAKRGKEKKQDPLTQVRESEVARRAQAAAGWARDHGTIVVSILAAVVLAVIGFVGWRMYTSSQAEASAALLERALRTAQGEIVREADADAAERDPDDPPRFRSERQRAGAALRAFRRVSSRYPGSDSATWARLGEAGALSELGRHAEAREAYDRAIRDGGSDPAVLWRALEGKGFTYEAEEDWDRALEVYGELSRVDNGRYEPIATYHVARMQLAKGERQRATEALTTLVTRLREAADDEESQDFAYVLAQAQLRLRELDPSAAPAAVGDDTPFGGGGLPGLEGLGGGASDEQLREFLRQFQEQQQRRQQGGGE